MMSRTDKFITITGEELMNANLPPICMIIRRLIPQGFHILAGAPKTGNGNPLAAQDVQYWRTGGGYLEHTTIGACGYAVIDVLLQEGDTTWMSVKVNYNGVESMEKTIDLAAANGVAFTAGEMVFQTGTVKVKVLDQTDENGEFSVELLPGTYKFGAFTVGWDNQYFGSNNRAVDYAVVAKDETTILILYVN